MVRVKVDETLYNKIKKETKAPKDDEKVAKKYGIGKTTVSQIRKSIDYMEFELAKIRKSTRKVKHEDVEVWLEPSPEDMALLDEIEKQIKAENRTERIVNIAFVVLVVAIIVWLILK